MSISDIQKKELMKNLQKFIVLTLCLPLLWTSCSDKEEPEIFSISIDGGVQTFSTTGGMQTLSFTSSALWTAKTDQSWCTVSPANGPVGKSSIAIHTEENGGPDERNATVTLTSGTVVLPVTITQKQKDALTLTSSKAEVGGSGGEVQVEVKANITFEYTVEESAVDWIIPMGTKGITTSSLKFTVKKNEDNAKREGKIRIHSGELSETFTVYQDGAEPELILTRNEYTVGSDATEIKIELKSNVPYEMKLPATDWITEKKSRAVSSYTHYISVAANESYSARSAEILFVYKEKNITKKVKITQMQKDAILVAQKVYKLPGTAGNVDFEVNANVDFEVSVSADWIKKVTKTRALTTTPLSFSIAENPDIESREGTITIKHEKISQEITIVQEGRKDFGRLLITHENQLFKVPTLIGKNLKGSILWGDTQKEDYKTGASHTYKNGGSHTVTLESWGAEEVVLSDIVGVTELNLTDF